MVDGDPRLGMSAVRSANNAVVMTFASHTLDPHYMTLRLGQGGPILDTVAVQTLALQSSDTHSMEVVQTFADGSELVEVAVNLGAVPANLALQVDVFGGGITFDDGTVWRVVNGSAFTADGQYTYYLVRSADSLANFCHSVSLQQAGQTLALW